MNATAPTTRIQRLSRVQALAVGVLTLAMIVWGVWRVWPSEAEPRDPTVPVGGDLGLHQAIVERVRAGENYYDATDAELRAGDYPRGSLFNWRTPLHIWVLANAPSMVWGQALLLALALLTQTLAYAVLVREGGRGLALVHLPVLLFAFLPALSGETLFPGTASFFLFVEYWSGTLIALSVCACGLERWTLGAIAGLLALFFRELALPYCLVAVALAWWGQRRAELATWLAGLALYAVYLAWHAWQVSLRNADAEPTSLSRWFDLGGLTFLVISCRVHGLLAQFPDWVAAVYLPLAILGLAGWKGPTATRIGVTAGLYLAAFSLLGRPFNLYWGLMYAPLLTFGFVWALPAVRDLVRAVVWPVSSTSSN